MTGFNPLDPFNDEEFEFDAAEQPNPQKVNDAVQQAYKTQMQSLEKMILPILKNLMKNPENETIKWPNRSEAIKTQITKITSITRSKLDY